jgi:2-hydroxychromene-2-carboxylate isomerase
MSEQLETIKLYYDYKSPFAYLAMAPAYALEQSHRVKLHFIPHELNIKAAFGGELPQRDERSWRKVRYLYLDARRYANARGLIIRGPQKIFDSRLALMSGLWADRHGKFRAYSDRVFERFFKRELDIEDGSALGAVMKEVGLDADGFRRYALGEGPRELKGAFAEGERDGVFGVPTFIVAGEPFWGNDRVEWLVKKLDAMGLRRAQPTSEAQP